MVQKELHELKMARFKELAIVAIICLAVSAVVLLLYIKHAEIKEEQDATLQELLASSQNKHQPIDIYAAEKLPFNEYMLYEHMRNMKIQNIEIVFAQAQLETGYFKCEIFTLNNNIFGMKKSYERPSMFEKKKAKKVRHLKKFAYYINWKNSVIDYALWQSAYARNLSFQEYIDKLNAVYDCTYGKHYGQKLLSIVNRNKLKLKTYAAIFEKNR